MFTKALLIPAAVLVAAAAANGAPASLRCEYMVNPMGIDSAAPHLSWQSNSTGRNWKQSAYQVLVASTAELLRAGKADVWDSGRQSSSESVGIVYAGKRLESGKRYWWTVRVWDADHKMTAALAPAWWEMGMLREGDWTGKWISRQDTEEQADRAGIQWLWVEGKDPFAAPPSTAGIFRLEFNLTEKPRNAALFLLPRAPSTAQVNGSPAGAKDGRFLEFDRQDITELLVVGKNVIEVTLKTAAPRQPGAGGFGGPPPQGAAGQPGQAPRPGQPARPAQGGAQRRPQEPRATAVAGLLKVTKRDGSIERFPTGARWQARLGSEADWRPAAVVAALGDKRMGADSGPLPGAASLLRREFRLAKPIRRARLYITALGSYRAFLNGKRVGADYLTPDYTEYAKRVTYQTYDVTALLGPGANAAAVMLGDGWFGSGMSWTGVRFSFLPPPVRLMAQLRIEFTDGSSETVATDERWKAASAPVLHSEIYAGEIYDARLEQPGWDKPGFNDAKWNAAVAGEAPPAVLSAQSALPVRVVETLKPVSIKAGRQGGFIADMGQNMVGWIRLTVSGAAGTKVRLRFAEILNPDGTLYVDNLRNANQTDAYFLRGGGVEVFAPHFTFHGFRYVEITGFPGTPTAASLVGEVASSAQTLTGKLTTASELVNTMWKTGIWGQRGNFLSIPTDCPQRDERLGWTGDAQVFWRTGAYNADIAAFGRKWMKDVADGQSAEGSFGNTAPNLPGGGAMPGAFASYGAPGWGDAGVIVPWTAWQQFGDRGIVAGNWSAMQRWMKFIEKANPDYLRRNKTGANFADWLPAGEQSPRDLVATAYWAMIARMMSQMAAALGKTEDAAQYEQVHARIQQAFEKEFVKETGEVGNGSQTSHLLALHMGLVPNRLKAAVLDRLVKNIEGRNWHLTSGFLGTPHLLFVLADNGRADVAYRLLLNETFPSWGYMIRNGATTWWERWNSDKGDPAMNSFNHYAFGSVMAWVYRYVAGIDTAADAPGFRKIVIRPRLDDRMPRARGEYDSVYGKIVSDWEGSAKGPFRLKVTVPANTSAKVYLPAAGSGKVTEAGNIVPAVREGNALVVEVGSGTYEFRVN